MTGRWKEEALKVHRELRGDVRWDGKWGVKHQREVDVIAAALHAAYVAGTVDGDVIRGAARHTNNQHGVDAPANEEPCDTCGGDGVVAELEHFTGEGVEEVPCSSRKTTAVRDLMPGDAVVALRPLDRGAVPSGSYGIVYHEADYHEDGSGPVVLFFILNQARQVRRTHRMNVYENDVKKI